MPRPTPARRFVLLFGMASMAFLTLCAACSSGPHHAAVAVSPTQAAVRAAATVAASGTAVSAAAAPPAATAPASAAAGTPAPPAQTPAAAAPPASAAPQSPAGATPTPVLITVPTPPPPDSGPCKPGQIKGDKATKTFYTPGLIGYNDLTSNVDCFNTIDAATAAGYHLPGQP